MANEKMKTHVGTPSTKTTKATGAPKGNQNAVSHGVFSLEGRRKRGRIDKRTSPYRAIKKLEREVTKEHIESRKRWHARNVAQLEYYCRRIDEHLLALKHIIRKGKVNPAVDLRLRLGDAVDSNYDAYDALISDEKPLDLARRYQREAMMRENGGQIR